LGDGKSHVPIAIATRLVTVETVTGYAHIACLPGSRILGLSKFAGSWTYTRGDSSCKNGSQARSPNALATQSIPAASSS